MAIGAAGEPSRGDPLPFDYDTISDVMLHIRYTAREGGALLGRSALESLKMLVEESRAPGPVRLFSVRHEFPTEWSRFRNQPPAAGERRLTFTLRPEHYPFWIHGRLHEVGDLSGFARNPSPTGERSGTPPTMGRRTP
jgi:hypothetical protein